jgi:vacuolar-type H+-ATPase subunit E/Vma4
MAEATGIRARAKEDLSNILKQAFKTLRDEAEMRGYKKTRPSVLGKKQKRAVCYYLLA